ncbi:hypothetical protein CTI12_AA497200 [Artemisia annua]|uniref:Uncharacterized protein n=1 Tax=Artemisia annua TaxID=35608 RepID=A0A2U1LFA4_ARTAN|nr:hypothetical protein CTI12_AA497200 [Artemisia annua]
MTLQSLVDSSEKSPGNNVNSWSLPIVALTCIVVALSPIPKDRVENLVIKVLVKVYPKNTRKWLKHTLSKVAFEGKTTTKILNWFADKAEETLMKISGSSNRKMMENDMFAACFTNIPRVITMKCHERVIDKREASVKVAAKLLGKTTKIMERLETFELPPIMDHDKMAYIDKWRLYLKQSVP